jgi:hypothetical protein
MAAAVGSIDAYIQAARQFALLTRTKNFFWQTVIVARMISKQRDN